MKGILIEKAGGIDVLQYKSDIPVPLPKDGEVLIKNDFIGVNYIDTLVFSEPPSPLCLTGHWQSYSHRNFRSGRYPAPKPQILGVEAEGTIVSTSSTGEIYGLKPGDHVVWIGTGAYAEYSVCSASKVYVLPSGLEPGAAAASLSQGLTALIFIEKAYYVQKGDWILVQGASRGVGLWLCQLLKAVGARVIGTASTAEKMKLATGNGADFILNYSNDNILERVMEITKGEGVAAVFDSVGASTFEIGIQALSRDGTMVSYGNTSGSVPPFQITELSAKNLKLMRPSVFGTYPGSRFLLIWGVPQRKFLLRHHSLSKCFLLRHLLSRHVSGATTPNPLQKK
jgi:NADPH2:quinone reductase